MGVPPQMAVGGGWIAWESSLSELRVDSTHDVKTDGQP